MAKQAYLSLFVAIFLSPSAWAQQMSQPSLDFSDAATIKCHDRPYVSLTADAEQALPLQVVATLHCNEEVSILSDPQGYTIQVRTAGGKIGYVARFEVTIEQASGGKAAVAETNTPSNQEPLQGEATGETPSAPRPDAQEGGSSKPRIYVSDTESWTASGGFANPSSVAPGSLYGGYNPEMVDIYQDFTSDCPAAAVTQQKSNADYVVLFDKQSSKKGLAGLGGLVKVNNVRVLSKSGDTLLSQTSHSVDTAVRLACEAIGQRSGASSAPAEKLAP